ncbi:glycosyltransferase family 39 protein [Candidatus Daviesbacteria bacterium]|nr:glycosyltransferase family 39 protein [Candidatus Daviesbacteria bacterium]
MKLFTKPIFYLLLIVLGAFILRLYKIDAPLADWHSWRQADTAAVTRNFIKEGLNPFFPKFDDISAISENPLVNPNRFRFVEFPIYNIFTYPLYLFFGINEAYHRLVSVLFSLGSIVFIYLITKKYANTFVALLSAFIFAFLPFSIFFSRTILPEPTFLFFSLGMLYFVDKWITNKGKSVALIAYIFTAVAFLIKPWAIFFTLPVIYSFFQKHQRIWPVPLKYVFFVILALAPFLLWRLWILQQPQGIPASSWLLNSDAIRFKPAFWWWIISERIGREILGATGAVLFYIGILKRPKNYFFHTWLISSLLFIVIFATGNVRHNYYQISFVPIASIFTALGFYYLVKGSRELIVRLWTIPVAILFLALTFYFTWLQVKGFYQINNPVIVEAGKKADQILPKDALVVAPYNGDTAFLYQTNRAGFPFVPLPVPDLITQFGVTHFVSTSKDDQTNWVMKHFKILEENDKYVIVDLREITTSFDKETI